MRRGAKTEGDSTCAAMKVASRGLESRSAGRASLGRACLRTSWCSSWRRYGAVNEKKLLSFLGLAARARTLACGQEAALKGTKSGKAKLVVLDGSASERTRKAFGDACNAHGVPLIVLDGCGVLGPAIGKPANRIAAVTQESFASKALEKWEDRS